jgi:peptide/nickel transport system substrate-binding protein
LGATLTSNAAPPRASRGRLSLLYGALIVLLLGTAVAAAGGSSPASSSKTKSLTVLQNTGAFGNWPGLDPATDTSDAANGDYMNSIFGELFRQGPKGVIPDLVTSYKLSSDLQTLDLDLRQGVTFSDGTPFNADAVAFNIRRDLEPQNACLCLPNFPVSSITTPSQYTVVLQLSKPFAAIVDAFPDEAPNWIVSPTALSKMGEKAFALSPVGAGPFEVVSDEPSSKLVLKRNPDYWQKGRPLLDNLTFETVGNDQAAYAALLSGQGQAYEDFTSYDLIQKIKSQLQVTPALPSGTGAGAVQLNTTRAPFNNIVAREAIYYATQPGPINKALNAGYGTVTQSLRAPGQLFYEPKVPGYRTYNPAKAKALVSQLGGLSFQLDMESAPAMAKLATVLASEWARAGIKVSINLESFEQNIQDYGANNWEAKGAAGGGYDPAIGLGLNFWYASHAPFTGIKDPTLDAMISQGASTANQQSRAAIYRSIYKYISDQAYSPVLFAVPWYNLAVHGVSGPGLTTAGPEVFWVDVS